MGTTVALQPSPSEHVTIQQEFLQLLPCVERHAAIVFRGLPTGEREELIAESRAAAYVSYLRLRQRRKDPHRFPSAIATRAAQHAKSGRRVGGHATSRDVLSWAARLKHGFTVRSLHHPAGDWNRFLRDDHATPVWEQAAFRIDWPAFVARQSPRDRRIMHLLAEGHSVKRIAQRVGLSMGRLSQLRRQWCEEWRTFTGQSLDNDLPQGQIDTRCGSVVAVG
jgi:hypothetical protein